MRNNLRSALSKRATYETLNGMRGVAAICVVIFHMHDNFWPGMAESGYLAVDIFFTLSGFVLADAYGSKLRSGELRVRGFAARRLKRFYPLYFVGLCLGVAKVLSQHMAGSSNALDMSAALLAIVPALLFLPAIGEMFPTLAPLNVPAWSLLYEFWVNILWASVNRRFGSGAQIATLAVAGAIFATCTALAGTANLGTTLQWSWGGVARTIFSFTAGLMIHRIRRPARVVSGLWPALILLTIASLLFLAPGQSHRVAYDLVIALLISPLLVFAASCFEPSASLRPICVGLGALSFPLYAIHAPLIAMGIFAARMVHLPPVVSGCALLFLMLAAAWLAGLADGAVQKRLTHHLPRSVT